MDCMYVCIEFNTGLIVKMLQSIKIFLKIYKIFGPPLCRVPGYRSRGLGFDSRRYQIF
jgi:hypothetical protein